MGSRLLLALVMLPGGLHGSVQGAVDVAFQGRAGTAVVVRVADGKLIASHRLDIAAGTLANPGSALKPFVLEALRGPQAADLKLVCDNRLRIGTRQMACTHLPLSEPVDAHRALAYSCNTWFAEASRRLSAADMRQLLLRAGLASSSGFVSRELSGIVELADNDDHKRLQALGEWGIRVTPLALAAAYRKLALRARGTALAADLTAAAEVGTAQLALPLGGSIAAKTGTTRDGAWLAGWMPANQPEVVLVVYLPRGSGGSDAALVARIMLASLMPVDPRGVKVLSEGHVLALPFEEYVAGVAAGEAGAIRQTAAVKAVTIAARTWAAASRGRHRAEGFDFCSTTHCQSYQPGAITAAVVAAVRDTAGELLWFQGRPALSYYGRNCGGVTEEASRVWADVHAPYLRQQNDPWCRSHGRKEWQSEVEKSAVSLALAREGIHVPRTLGSVAVLSRTPSGRVSKLSVEGVAVAGSAFRFALGRQLGWSTLPSAQFEIRDEGSLLAIYGTGSGHGVGLCQDGATRMAEQGRSYNDILAFYYPGTALSRVAKGLPWTVLESERARLFTTAAARDAGVLRTADLLAAQVERRTGLHFRARPELRLFPSVAAFRDGTGEPGWVAGSTRGNEIRIYPGVPNSVLRHELLHVLTSQNAAPGLPVWFREGIVLYLDNPAKLAGPQAVQAEAPAAHAETAQEYEAARSRVKSMVDEKGEAAVLRYIASGLPAGTRM